MLNPGDIEEAARLLDEAERSRKQTGLISLRHPGATLDDAYAIQSAFVKRKLAAGRRGIGWKIGLTSRAMQDALKIDTPDSGILLDDMVFENGASVPAGRFIQPRIEAEIAFVMKRDLSGTKITLEEVLAATDHIRPALEILDTRILRADPATGKARTIIDTISDNAANAGIVLGGKPEKPYAQDMRWIGAIVTRNGIVEETGLGAGVLDHPARGIVWLIERLARYGEGVKAGEVLLSGSFIRPIEASSGSEFVADYGAFGKVACRFL